MKKIYLLLTVVVISLTASAQKEFFKDITENKINLTSKLRVIFPVNYRTTNLDFSGMKVFLKTLPLEQNLSNRQSNTHIDITNA